VDEDMTDGTFLEIRPDTEGLEDLAKQGEPLEAVEVRPLMNRQEEWAYALWNALIPQAEWKDELQSWIWEGKISSLHQKLGISQPYFQMIYTHLVRMGCVSVERRGGGGKPSLLLLRRSPTSNLFQTGNTPRTTRSLADSLGQQVRDLVARVAILEQMAHVHPEVK
jgi:hypothetical protein